MVHIDDSQTLLLDIYVLSSISNINIISDDHLPLGCELYDYKIKCSI